MRPNSAGNTTLQNVVLDSNQHGVKLSATGTWMLRYNGADVNSGVAATFNAWSHVMVVRPAGLGCLRGLD